MKLGLMGLDEENAPPRVKAFLLHAKTCPSCLARLELMAMLTDMIVVIDASTPFPVRPVPQSTTAN